MEKMVINVNPSGTGLLLEQEADLGVRATQGSEVLPASTWTAAATAATVAP
jgi:hypothetical protein